MDITSVGLQASPNIVGNNASGAVVGIQQTNGANSAARNANVATENQPPASTRVTISAEGQARLAAEQASGAQATPPATPAPAQEAALTPAAEPVTQTAAAAPVEAGASAAVGQGATQAAASIPVATATPIAASATNAANANAPTPAGAGAPTTNAQPATPETSAAVRQTVDGNAQQAEVRQNDAAAARQDASPVVAGTGANTARSALAA
ncbi:hypothetical protein FACS1894185_5070 [Betaproteobacteria bacterium]|nr:hypothetical protein FACS1894185_5070 [Betaproteobacteria bacterium]